MNAIPIEIPNTVRVVVLAAMALAVTACSGSKTATTRKDQETEFKELFGIAPPAAVVAIRYHEAWGGGYERWMSFTYDPATYDAILKNGYKPSKDSDRPPTTTSTPAWWPKADPPQSALYVRSPQDTPEDEGYQFEEYLWHDASSGVVFLHKSYWD